MARESKFQSELINELEDLFPGCIVLKNDTAYIQGIPDLLVLYKHNWAALECKRSLNESYQPNQEYYLDLMDDMSFASMICPENREAVLYELQRSFSLRRTTCISKR
jgi:hypothetical protein